MRKRINKFIVCGVIISLLASCAKLLDAEPIQESGIPVQVSMSVKIPSFTSPQGATKSTAEPAANDSKFKVSLVQGEEQSLETRSSGTTSLYNLWVLQFASDKTARKISKISNIPAPVKDMITIDAELFTGADQTIYLVALGKQYESINLSGITSVDELENFSIPFIKYEDGIAKPIITEEEDVPYQGSQAGLNIIQIEKGGRGLIEYSPSANFSGAINIRAMVSKISADFSFAVSGLSPYLLMLNNVPTSFAINSPSYKASSVADIPAIELVPSSFASGKRQTFSWYVAPNPQGVVSAITSETSRYCYIEGSTWAGLAPKEGTYLNFWASSTTKQDTYAQYYMFVGGNTTNDFNIYANTSYNLRGDINSDEYATDKRIKYGTLVQSVDFGATAMASPTLPGHKIRTSGNYSFDAHPDMRPIEISALRGTVKIDILKSPTDTEPIASADSWLKLSSYPNYTEAVNKQKTSDPEGLVSSIIKRANIPGLFKFYVYSDEYLAYVSDPNEATNKDRTLYIRFTFHVSDVVADDVIIVKMDQRASYYVGQFGGTFDINTGQYSEGLVYESVQEFNSSIQYLSYYKPATRLNRGIYDARYSMLCEKYQVGDLRNGKVATLRGATNPSNLKFQPVSASYAKEPRYVGGKLDLYQYNIQKLNYFAARYCYDKNRDSNGDGVINPDEYNWYVPAATQVQALIWNTFGVLRPIMTTDVMVSMSQSDYSNSYSYTAPSFIIANSFSGNNDLPKCVRNMPTDPKMPQGFKAYVEDGYAVIDAMGMSPLVREDRATNRSLIFNDDMRTIRHFDPRGVTATSQTLSSKVSARFRVAPFDIDPLGAQANIGAGTGLMNWADASGYNQVGNSWVMSEPLGTAQTGCPMYAGKNGGEEGLWRLPTINELQVIELMDSTFIKTTAQTGYKGLLQFNNANYWASTESKPNDITTPVVAALYLTYQESYSSGLINKRIRWQANAIGKTTKSSARCIRDLPEK